MSLGDRADRGELKPEVAANLLRLVVIKSNNIVDTGITISTFQACFAKSPAVQTNA
jgi:hypothetical protein